MKIQTKFKKNRRTENPRKLMVAILSDSQATLNRDERNSSLTLYCTTKGASVRQYKLDLQGFRERLRELRECNIVISQVSPRRNVIASLAIIGPRIILELRDPICDWRFRRRVLGKALDILLVIVARLWFDEVIARRNLTLNWFELALLRKKLLIAPEFGVNTSFLDDEIRSDYSESLCYFGNIYDEFYVSSLERLSDRQKTVLIWAGTSINSGLRLPRANVRQVSTKPKSIAYSLQRGSLANVLINSSGTDFVPSKFFELLAFGRPIIYLTRKRDRVSYFIENNGIGISICEDSDYNRLPKLGELTDREVRNLSRVARISRVLFGHEHYHQALWGLMTHTGRKEIP